MPGPAWSADITAFLGSLPASRQDDARELARLMEQATGAPPRLWGSMVGFGDRHYRYESGREGDTFVLGFASRKEALVLYLGEDTATLGDELEALGPHKAGKGCVYVKRLDDVDIKALKKLLKKATQG